MREAVSRRKKIETFRKYAVEIRLKVCFRNRIRSIFVILKFERSPVLQDGIST